MYHSGEAVEVLWDGRWQQAVITEARGDMFSVRSEGLTYYVAEGDLRPIPGTPSDAPQYSPITASPLAGTSPPPPLPTEPLHYADLAKGMNKGVCFFSSPDLSRPTTSRDYIGNTNKRTSWAGGKLQEFFFPFFLKFRKKHRNLQLGTNPSTLFVPWEDIVYTTKKNHQ